MGGVILLSVIGFVLSRMYDYQCFFLDSACSCILYYALGHHFKNSRFEGWHPRLFYLILCGITLLTTVAVLRPDVALVRNRYPLYLPLIAVPLILVLFYAVKRSHSHIKRFSDCLSWLGDNSLAILGIHSVYYYLFDVFFADRLCGLQFATLKFVTTLPLIYISVILIKIIFPNIFGKYETKRI